jgi:hypothetical protein
VGSGEIRGQLINDNPPSVDNSAQIASLKKKIKKITKAAKKAQKKGQVGKARRLAKKVRVLKAKLRKLQ